MACAALFLSRGARRMILISRIVYIGYVRDIRNVLFIMHMSVIASIIRTVFISSMGRRRQLACKYL